MCSESHLSFDYPVHYGLHGFHLVALHDSFKVLRAMFQSLGHRDVQVVVRLLSSQVLRAKAKVEIIFSQLNKEQGLRFGILSL